MKKENEIISIIIPVYNCGDLLSDCLDSVVNQTYKNLEIVIVDDGSTDGSGEICDKYAQKDCRIKVIHKKNEGASVARNVALDLIQGEYVGFVDGDDTIELNYYEILHGLMHKENVDAVLCNLWFFECEQEKVFENILLDNIGGHLTKWLFKRNLWDGIRMPVGRLVQDAAVIYKVIYKAKTHMINKKLYHYYDKNPNNVSNKKRNLYKGAIDRAIMFIDRYEWVKEKNLEKEAFILQTLINKVVSFGVGAIGLYKEYPHKEEDIKRVKTFFSSHKKEINESNLVSSIRKNAVNLIIFSPAIYYYLKKAFFK